MPVVGAAFLLAIGRALTRIHVGARWSSAVAACAPYPSTGQPLGPQTVGRPVDALGSLAQAPAASGEIMPHAPGRFSESASILW